MRFQSALAVAAAVVVAGFTTVAVAQTPAPPADPANTLILELKYGKVTIQMRPDLAPGHVERVKTLTKQGFYNGLKFHRVINEFMAQTGDPTGTGGGGSKLGNVKAEFTPEPYRRGTIGAARTADPNSADSQFFICFTDFGCDPLRGKYTVWGKVTSGMQYVDQIKKGEPPSDPDTIVKMYLASDGAGTPAKKP
ncbi:MAG: peptidylprolyl isomerase [Hyphomicrobium aestuarii]|nr:peptidylprolyl isomerase [Hyphomicrobium aestuarii]